MPAIPFSPGRSDCPTSPSSPDRDNLPHPATTTTEELFNWFRGALGFEPNEAAAIMGAHAFGRTFKVLLARW